MQVTEKLSGLSSASSPRPCRGREAAAMLTRGGWVCVCSGAYMLGTCVSMWGPKLRESHVYILLHKEPHDLISV